MREIDEYEKNYFASPERAAKEKQMWNEFYRGQAEQNYEKGHGCATIVAIILLYLILYFSLTSCTATRVIYIYRAPSSYYPTTFIPMNPYDYYLYYSPYSIPAEQPYFVPWKNY